MRRSLIALVLALVVVTPVNADGGDALAGLVASRFGVYRITEPTLQNLAAVRSVEISVTFAHRPLPELTGWNWGEVIALNRYTDDPLAYAIEQWAGSPPHAAILSDPVFTMIGCDRYLSGVTSYIVCIVGTPSGGTPPLPGPPLVLPDTAMH